MESTLGYLVSGQRLKLGSPEKRGRNPTRSTAASGISGIGFNCHFQVFSKWHIRHVFGKAEKSLPNFNDQANHSQSNSR